MPGWIPCEEKLPEQTGLYIVTVKETGECSVGPMWYQDGRWGGFNPKNVTSFQNVLAWMPFPSPYERRSE